jgi:hypothetical protein
MEARNHFFPKNLPGANVPFMRITANRYQYGGGGPIRGSLSIYQPPNVSFGDGASFGTIDMGPIGSTLMKGISSGMGAEGAFDLARAVNAEVEKDSDLRTMIATKIAAGSGIGSSVPGVENLADIYSLSKGKAVNPNSVSSFQNMTTRSFTFTFKLIAEEPSESESIRDIVNFFRREMYAAASASAGYLLTYPSTFTIKFYSQDGKESTYYPKIYECFLTGMTTSYNTQSHMHFDGGAPIDVDLSFTFQETKVLTQGDINEYGAN